MRRAGSPIVSLAVSLLAAACAGSPDPGPTPIYGAPWSDGPVVAIRAGLIRGTEDRDDTWVWRGIPYAEPPVGDLRWRAPQDPAPWAGILNTARFGFRCTQYRSVIRRAIEGDEDCLTLNVWRPKGGEVGLPVYVWIHGGGNSIGGSDQLPDYYGNRVASRSETVFVSVNYRLGPLGWFAHPAIAAGGTDLDASGNFGTLDLIHALRWVRDNIEAFGGDPGRVLIAGESAGGMNVLSLLISPLAKGLFGAAIVESGLATTRSLEEARTSSHRALIRLLVNARRARTTEEATALADTLGATEIASFLRSRSDREILRAYPNVLSGMISNPAILRDGTVIPMDGYGVIASGGPVNRVPLIVGSNKEEAKIFLFLDGSVRFRDPLYPAIARWRSEVWKADGVDAVARALVASAPQIPVYAYRFDWGAPDQDGSSPLPGTWGRRLGAFHGLEVSFFLGTESSRSVMKGLFFTSRNQGSRALLSRAMMRYAASLLRTGDPNPADGSLPRWEPWTLAPGGPKTLILDATEQGLAVRMTDTELTASGVEQETRERLGQAMYEEARRRMAGFGLSIPSDPL